MDINNIGFVVIALGCNSFNTIITTIRLSRLRSYCHPVTMSSHWGHHHLISHRFIRVSPSLRQSSVSHASHHCQLATHCRRAIFTMLLVARLFRHRFSPFRRRCRQLFVACFRHWLTLPLPLVDTYRLPGATVTHCHCLNAVGHCISFSACFISCRHLSLSSYFCWYHCRLLHGFHCHCHGCYRYFSLRSRFATKVTPSLAFISLLRR